MNLSLKKHYGAFILAFTAAIATGLPQIIAARSTPGFAGVYKEIINDEVYYLARARDVTDGHGQLANPYIAEHKDGSPVQFWLPDYLLAKPLAFLGIPVTQGYIAYDFILPFILALASYAAAYLITRSVRQALLFVVFMNLGLFFREFTRAPSPQFNFIAWIAVFISFVRYLQTKKAAALACSGIAFGFLFHLYPYYWTFWTVVFGLFLLWNMYERNRPFVFATLKILSLGFIIGAPYFSALYQASQLRAYEESMIRLGLLYTRFPSGFEIVVVSGLIVCAYIVATWRKRLTIDDLTAFVMCGLIASIVSVNHHIITGKNLEFSSHYNLLSFFWAGCAAFFLYQRLSIAGVISRRYLDIGAAVGITAIIVFSATETARVVRKDLSVTPEDAMQQRYAPIFSWFSRNALPDEVVFANSVLSELVPVYTAQNVYYARSANLFYMTDEEVMERFMTVNFWRTVDAAFVADNERALFGTQFINSYGHNMSKNKLRRIARIPSVNYTRLPQDAVQKALDVHRFVTQQGFEKSLKRYAVDYIVHDTASDPDWRLGQYPFLRKAYESDGFIIYEVL